MTIEFTTLEFATAVVSGLWVGGIVATYSGAPFPVDDALFVGSSVSTMLGILAVIAWIKTDLRR